MSEYAHISDETVAMLRLSERAERLKARRDARRGTAILFLLCGVIDAAFLVWDLVKHNPWGADCVEGGLMVLCLGFGFRVWREWRILCEQYDQAHASYMLALRGDG